MKIIELRVITLAFVLLLSLSHNIYAQKDKMDIFSEEYLKKKLDSIRNNELRIKSLYDELSRNFNDFQMKNIKNGNNILTSFLYDSYLPRNSTHEFLLRNKDHFSDDQVQKIRAYLEKKILPTDHYYHILVSRYKLYSQLDFLKENISDSLFYFIREEINRKYIIPYKLEFQLRNWSTLVNFENDFNLEDSLLSEINSLYSFCKKEKIDKIKIEKFYYLILVNALPFINSKNSVIKTFYMLDESVFAPDEYMSGYGYQKMYFDSVIQPKIKSSDLKIIGFANLINAEKVKIKEMILNDNTIWKDYIRIDR